MYLAGIMIFHAAVVLFTYVELVCHHSMKESEMARLNPKSNAKENLNLQIFRCFLTSSLMTSTAFAQPDSPAEDSNDSVHQTATFYSAAFGISHEHALHLIAACDGDILKAGDLLIHKGKGWYWVDKWRRLCLGDRQEHSWWGL